MPAVAGCRQVLQGDPRVGKDRSRYGRAVTAAPRRSRALLLLLAGALVLHLFTLSDMSPSQAGQHAGTAAAMAGSGGLHLDLEAASPESEPLTMGHAMAVACLAVLAAGGVLLGLQRALAHREALTAGRPSASTWMVRVRDLWPPPRAESSRIDGGVLLLI